MPEDVSSHEISPLRSLSSHPIFGSIDRVLIFLLGLLLGLSPLFIASLVLLLINSTSPISPTAPYHGAFEGIGRAVLFRTIQDLLVLLLLLCTPLFTHWKRTRLLSYGLVGGLLFFIGGPLFAFVIFVLFHHGPASSMLLPSSLLGWFSLLKDFLLPVIGLTLVPFFGRASRHFWLGYVVALIVAALFFFQSPIHYWL